MLKAIRYHFVSTLMGLALAVVLVLPARNSEAATVQVPPSFGATADGKYIRRALKADSDNDHYFMVYDNQTLVWSTSELRRVLPPLRPSDIATGGYRCRVSLCFDREGYMVGAAPTAKLR